MFARPLQRESRLLRLASNLLWIDGIAAASAGVAVLSFSGLLHALHGLPQDLLILLGQVNLLYALYSLSLALRARRPMFLIKLLILANGFWALVCLALTASYGEVASAFGIGHLLGEAVFVGGLASLEWKWRERLLQAP